jgi:hypothetical protein
VATFVHDALAEIGRVPRLAPLCVAPMHRLRTWILTAEEPEGMWRFLGPGGAIDPDSDCTACAATVAVVAGRDPGAYLRALDRFRYHDGTFASYLSASGDRYAWIGRSGAAVAGTDRVVNANVARFLARSGIRDDRVWAFLSAELAGGMLFVGSPDYPSEVSFPYMAARALRDGGRVPDAAVRARVVDHLLHVLTLLRPEDRPLSYVMARLALHDLDRSLRPPAFDLERLVRAQAPDGTWAFEPFFVGDYGSPELTTSLAVQLLVRLVDPDRAVA